MGPSPAGTQGRCVLREFRRRGGGRERGSFSIKSVTVVTVYGKKEIAEGGEGRGSNPDGRKGPLRILEVPAPGRRCDMRVHLHQNM